MSALAGVPVGSTASVRQLRVAGTGLQPRLHDKTTRRTDPAGSTLATPDFGPKDGVHLRVLSLSSGVAKRRIMNSRRSEKTYLTSTPLTSLARSNSLISASKRSRYGLVVFGTYRSNWSRQTQRLLFLSSSDDEKNSSREERAEIPPD